MGATADMPTPRRPFAGRFAFLFVLFVATPWAVAQFDDFRAFEHSDSGMKLKTPPDFKAIPTQPTEKILIARFARTEPYLARKVERDRRPESFSVFVIKAASTGTTQPSGPPKTHEENVARMNAVSSWKEVLASRFPGFEAKPFDDAKEKAPEKPFQEFRLKGPRPGYMYVRDIPGFTVGVVGMCDEEVFDTMVRRYRFVGQSIQRLDNADRASEEAIAFYDGKDFRDPLFRADQRKKLLKEWRCKDTDNFLIVYHTQNTKLINQIAGDLEAIRPLYMKYFPAAKPIEAVSVVRVCKDLDEYHRYGGPRGSGGYWNFVAKELVLFDYSAVPGSSESKVRHMSEKDSYLVLYHEAFHQYIYYAAGEVAPHSWFNEGLGDVFSGTIIYDDSLRVKEIGFSRWRIHVVKDAETNDKWVSLAQLIKAEQHEYYNPAKVSVMYAEGWAFCYFLLIAKDGGQKNEKWAKIIPTYFETLKAAQAKRVGLLSSDSSLGDRMKAQAEARADAVAAAFRDVDIDELEAAWRSWIRRQKDPWAAFRKS